jgi:UDP-N-acetylglucosamine--N-acetylmuramyl-(pentapeptide) pyrophosphoryl-undecaprenol N-acetylglucosamine transferase
VTVYVIAGGGTAGHVLPELAIADALVDRGIRKEDIHFVGARRGMEAKLVPARGYVGTWLDVRGVRRSAHPANVGAAGRLGFGTAQAVRLFRTLHPQVVVSVGGYASVPPVAAARLLGIPIVAVSYDAVPGRASQIAARIATVTATAFPDVRPGLPRAVVTGAPLRREIVRLDRDRERPRAREAFQIPLDRFVVLVVGGSLGSGLLNEVTAEFVADRRDDRSLAVRHVLGERNARERLPRAHDGWDGLLYQPVAYEARVDLAYAAADLVVARAGATTVAELAAVGAPSVLVPWKLATEDHQRANARFLAEAEGAVVVDEDDFDAARMGVEVDGLLNDPARLGAMAAAAHSVGRRDGAERIAALVERVAAGLPVEEAAP